MRYYGLSLIASGTGMAGFLGWAVRSIVG